VSKQERVFSRKDIAAALIRVAPELPRILGGTVALRRASADQQQSTGLLFETKAAEQPDRPFVLFKERRWTYGEFNAWVNQLARTLKGQGVRAGDSVALMFENSPELLACVLAVNKLGGIAALLNYHQRGEVLHHSVSLVKPAMVVMGAGCTDAIDRHWDGMDRQVVFAYLGDHPGEDGLLDMGKVAALEDSANLPETAEIRLGQKCFYIFTSGTTGMPKAAAMTHLRWLKAGLGMGRSAMRLTEQDVMYCPLPLYHNNGLTVSLSSVIQAGAAIALARKFSASHFWEDIRAYQATGFTYIGELCRYLLSAPPSDLDRAHQIRVIIGNGMRPEIWDEFQQRFGIEHICEFYGASENNAAFVNVFNLRRTAGFCPLPYAIVRFDAEAEEPLRADHGFMERIERGDVGLLITEVSQKAPFDGYTDAKASEAKVLRNVFQDGDCWFNSGDLVMDQGFRHIAFVDRVGDTFRWKGENVATTEVEGCLQAYDGVAEVAVYGVKVPHADGRAGMAAITPIGNGGFDVSGLYAYLEPLLPSYAIPLFLRTQREQETTSTFKVKKATLKRQGFELSEVQEPVYVLRDRSTGYVPLTPDLLAEIQAGHVRL